MLELIGRAQAQISDIETLSPLDPGSWSLTGSDGIIVAILNWFLIIAGAIAVIYLIYGGVLYITAGGDAEKATKGRTAVINAVIGVVIILLALVIVSWVNSLVSTGTV
jgi:hypothetical protein